jgi:hypothetical protein
MTTYRDLITRSMRHLGVVQLNQAPTPQEMADGLAAMNDMLNSWRMDGIDLEYVEATSVNNDVPYPQDHMAAFQYNLAAWLAPMYGKKVPDVIVGLAGKTYHDLQVWYSDPHNLTVDVALQPLVTNNLMFR